MAGNIDYERNVPFEDQQPHKGKTSMEVKQGEFGSVGAQTGFQIGVKEIVIQAVGTNPGVDATVIFPGLVPVTMEQSIPSGSSIQIQSGATRVVIRG